MKRFYDKKNNRLIYIDKASNSNFWDKHWSENSFEKMYPLFISPFDYVINNSKKYLSPGSKIIEGGCGIGQQVFKLQNTGFDVVGIDYAKKTIALVNKFKPQLNVKIGDVRKLDFSDNYFNGYWSFGVIEHFYNGYDRILSEMKRVIKQDGYLFVTFPHMNKLRKIKASRNKYALWKNNETDKKKFYQLALNHKQVISDFEKLDFKLIKKQHLSGIKGLKDEIVFLKNPLQKIFDSSNFFGIALSKIISFIFNKFSSHSILLVFKNQ